jgi:hypothetical protein
MSYIEAVIRSLVQAKLEAWGTDKKYAVHTKW